MTIHLSILIFWPLLLAGAVALAVRAGTAGPNFSLAILRDHLLSDNQQKLLFVAFGLAFLIKMPAFPFHGWMPDTYRNMPLPVLAVFSGVVSKVAAYGFLRIVLPLFPAAADDWQLIMLILAVCSILYGSIQAFTQTNMRLILGFSSVAQLGFIVLGIFALDSGARGAQGALLQAINHGLVGLAGAAVRRIQTGYLRYYAALLLLGITSLGAYFLVSA